MPLREGVDICSLPSCPRSPSLDFIWHTSVWVPHSSASYSFHLRGYDSVVSMWNSQYLLGKEHSWGVEGWRLNSNTTAFAAHAEDSSPVHWTHISELKTTCNSMPRNSDRPQRSLHTRGIQPHTHSHKVKSRGTKQKQWWLAHLAEAISYYMPMLSYFLSGKCILLTTSSLAVRPSVSLPPVEHSGNYEMCSLPLPSILCFSQCLTIMETRLQHTVPYIISSTEHMPFLYHCKTDKLIAARIV